MITRNYKTRVFAVFFGFVFLFSIIIIRLFLVQIKSADFFKKLGEEQYDLNISLLPGRGTVFDRNGTPLAFNQQVASAFLIPRHLEEENRIKPFLKKKYPDVYARLQENSDKYFLWLDRGMDEKKAAWLKKQDLADIHVMEEPRRFYPFSTFNHLIGTTDIDNNGIAGIEMQFNSILAGKPTSVRMERDARSKTLYFNQTITEYGRDGDALTLSLDSTLQTIAYDALKKSVTSFNAISGSVLVMNPDTGEVLVMANYPADEKNVPVCECFELGSVMKAFCAVAALDEDLVQPDEPINCEAQITYIDGVKVENPTIVLNNLLRKHNYIIPFYEIIRYSSNVGIAKVAKRLGPKLYDHLVRMGFNKKTGIEFPGERDGFVNHPSRWSKPSLIVMSFGYELMVSLIQVAHAFCIIANGGYAVKPTLIKQEKPVTPATRLYKQKTIDNIKMILDRGTKMCSFPNVQVKGKTGTVQCVKDGHYSKTAHRYTYAGIVEHNEYRRVVVTFIQEPSKASLWASEVAAPLFKSVTEHMIVHDLVHKK